MKIKFTALALVCAISLSGCTVLNQAIDMTQDYGIKRNSDYIPLTIGDSSFLVAFHPTDPRMIIMGSVGDKVATGLTLGLSGTDIHNERLMFNAASSVLGSNRCTAKQIFDVVAKETFEVTYSCPNGRVLSRADI